PHAGGEDAEASLRDTDRMVRVEREQALGLEIAHDALRGALRILEIGAEPLVDLLGVGTVDLLGEQMTSGGQDPSDLARTDRLMAGHDQVDRLIGDGHRLAGLGVVDQHLHAPRTSPRLGTHARLTRPDRPPGYGPSPRMADSAASPLVIQHLFNLIRNLVQEDLETGLLEGEVAAARKHHDPGLAAKPTKVVEAELRHSPTILGRVQQHDRWSLVLLGWNSRTRLEERAVPAHRHRATTAARVGEHCMTEARVVRNRRHRGQHADRDPWIRRWPPDELQQWQSQPR